MSWYDLSMAADNMSNRHQKNVTRKNPLFLKKGEVVHRKYNCHLLMQGNRGYMGILIDLYNYISDKGIIVIIIPIYKYGIGSGI